MRVWYIVQEHFNNFDEPVFWSPSCFEAMPDWTRDKRRAIQFANEQSAIRIIRNLTLVRAIPMEETLDE